MTLANILQGSRGGTVFHPHPKPIGSKKSWLAHAIKPLGTIELDDGACEAIQNRGASLLLVGITNVEGNFLSNQPVRIINSNSEEIARGISSLSSVSIMESLNSSLTAMPSPVVIHRDVLVLTNELLI